MSGLELQEALLPADLPVLPQVRVAARCLVAEQTQTASGDWFDAVPLADGRLVLIVGDVVGRGVEAAAAMGRLRAVIDDALIDSNDPGRAMTRADSFAARSPALRASTLCVVVLEPGSGRFHYCTSGHPAPMIVAADDTCRHLPSSGGSPLGLGAQQPFSTERLGLGETVVLFSDGVIERPGATLEEGRADLAEAIGHREGSNAEALCRSTVEFLDRHGAEDDATVLAAQRLAEPSPPLARTVPATTAGLTEVRAALARWLAAFELPEAELEGLDLAVMEVCTNTMRHAYRGRPQGMVRVEAELESDGILQLVVADEGRWRPPADPDPAGGRGLWIARSFIDDLSIEHGGSEAVGPGTVVRLRRRLRRPVQPATRPLGASRAAAGRAGLALQTDEAPPRVTAVGRIDITTVDRFADHLDRASRGGLRALTVDLRAVDLLASEGVRVLMDIRDRLATYGNRLELLAGVGTPAQTVLDLARLPWRVGQERRRGGSSPWAHHHRKEDRGDAGKHRARSGA